MPLTRNHKLVHLFFKSYFGTIGLGSNSLVLVGDDIYEVLDLILSTTDTYTPVQEIHMLKIFLVEVIGIMALKIKF